MKNQKKLLFASLLLGCAFSSNAQVWTGTAVPTTTTGAAGIGTTSPAAKLHVQSINASGYSNPALLVGSTNHTGALANNFEFYNYNASFTPVLSSLDFWMTKYGHVGIKRTLQIGPKAADGAYSNYTLSVDGDMIAKRCVIQIDSWADYVFNDNYTLPTLNEVEAFVNENKHLPGVPSEQEIKDQGLDMGEMNKILMQKVEELTLYIIDQNKKIEKLQETVNKL